MSNLQISPSLENLSHTVNSPHVKSASPSKHTASHKPTKYSYVNNNNTNNGTDENHDPNYSRNNAPQSSKASRSNSIVSPTPPPDTADTTASASASFTLTQRRPKHTLTEPVKFTPAEIKLQRARNLAFTRREQHKTQLLRDQSLSAEQVKSNNVLYVITLLWLVVIAIVMYVVFSAIYRGRTASSIGFTPIGDAAQWQTYKQKYANGGYANPAGQARYRD